VTLFSLRDITPLRPDIDQFRADPQQLRRVTHDHQQITQNAFPHPESMERESRERTETHVV